METLARQAGFDHIAPLEMTALEFLPEVRTMCAADRCHAYGRTWTCPPACGGLDEIAERCKDYRRGLLLQTTGALEDEFDAETMLSTEKLHKKRFYAFVHAALEKYPGALPMGAGACDLCQSCTWPDEPCRHPELAFPSMEAYGLFVSRVCERSGMKYYYGKNTMTFTSCILY